jgi:hypothetical protein
MATSCCLLACLFLADSATAGDKQGAYTDRLEMGSVRFDPVPTACMVRPLIFYFPAWLLVWSTMCA